MELNEKQKAVVEAIEDNILCIAPPGSGKTRVLVERAAHLIENKKVSPFELLLLTFTRKAAGEMRERLVERIGNKAYNIKIGTFHAVALGLIQRFGELIGLHPGRITVYGEWESSYLLKTIAIEMGVYKKAWKPKRGDIKKAFNDYYNSGIPPERTNPAYKIFRVFAARLRENNSLTYGSILTGLHLLLPHIKQYLKYKHVMTDESQDSDSLQWYLVRKIQKICKATLFCVADPDQSIYGWRGADADYLIRNQDEFTTYKLEINYRSDGHIVEAANNLISHNKNRIKKTMTAANGARTSIETIKNMDSGGIVKFYQSLKEGTQSAAILGRNHFLLEKMSQIMEEAKIQHTYIGKETKLTNSEEFRRFHAFLKLIVNPYDNFAFLLIRDMVDVSIEAYAKIRLRAAQEGMSHYQAWRSEGGTATPFEQAETLGKNSLNDVSDSIDSLFRSRYDAWESKTSDFIYQWVLDSPKDSISHYLQWLAVYDIQDEIKEETKGVQLMTMHAAKGLEFPTVIIAGMNEGILPSSRAKDIDEIEAERRLFFVAITRAEDKLIITTRPETSEFHGKVRVEPVSMFVKELYEANSVLPECDENDLKCPYMRPYRDKGNAQNKSYLLRHPGLKKKMDEKYYSENRDKILIQKKQYYKNNREQILKDKKEKAYQLKEENENLKLLLCWILMRKMEA